jgi:hypothetical protein
MVEDSRVGQWATLIRALPIHEEVDKTREKSGNESNSKQAWNESRCAQLA